MKIKKWTFTESGQNDDYRYQNVFFIKFFSYLYFEDYKKRIKMDSLVYSQ